MFNKRDENNESALRPEGFSMTSYVSQKPVEKDMAALTTEERILGEGANHAFWKTLEGHFLHELEKIELLNEQAIAQGASREQIGENTIIISLTKGVLRRIIGTVNDAKEAIDGQTRQQTGGEPAN